MGPSPRLELHVKVTSQAWAVLAGQVRDLGLAQAWTAHVQHAVELVVEEWFENLVMHAQANDAWLRIEDGDDVVQVNLRDDGAPFDPLSAPLPTLDRVLDDAPIGGLGLHLIRSFAKHVIYERQGPLNCLHLEVAKYP